MKLKIDLHTHCGEATGLYTPTLDIVKRIAASIKKKGLDGIGVTEHYNKTYGYKVKDMMERELGEDIFIIPGQEIDKGRLHVVVLYLTEDITFRFIAHPGYPQVDNIESYIDDTIHGIEIRNPNHDDEMDEELIKFLADKYNLMLLTNSDAHFLSDVGKYYNELDLEEMCSRAK